MSEYLWQVALIIVILIFCIFLIQYAYNKMIQDSLWFQEQQAEFVKSLDDMSNSTSNSPDEHPHACMGAGNWPAEWPGEWPARTQYNHSTILQQLLTDVPPERLDYLIPHRYSCVSQYTTNTTSMSWPYSMPDTQSC